MSEELEHVEEIGEIPYHDLMELFDEMTFLQKWKKVFHGLKQPRETGAYKFAKLQMIRLSAPVAAILVPLLFMGLLSLLTSITKEEPRGYTVQQMDPKPPEELPEPPEVEPPEPPDPVEMEIEFTTDAPVTPSDVQAPPTEYSPQPAEFDSVAMVKSPVVMRGIYGSRSPGARGSALAVYGGSGEGEEAVMRALRWFKKNQGDDGSWGSSKAAMTSLVLLAYLAHGETPDSPEFGDTIYRAIQFIMGCEQNGWIKLSADGHQYTTPIAGYALCEAYTMTDNPEVFEVAQRLVQTVIKGQNKWGGFNYGLKGPTDERNDLSYIAWCVQCLKAAKMASVYSDGLEEAMKKAIAGVKKNFQNRDGYGGFSYSSPGISGLTGAGTLCLQFLGEAKSAEVSAALNSLSKMVCAWDSTQIDRMHAADPLYYWYYATQAMFQSGGAGWKSWNKQFSPVLVKNQTVQGKAQSGYVDHQGNPQETGHWADGVPGTKVHGGTQNGVFPTVLCTLMLEVYYRYLPTFQAPKEVEGGAEQIEDADDDLEIAIF